MWSRLRGSVADRLAEPIAIPLGASIASSVLLALGSAIVGVLIGQSARSPSVEPLPRAVPVTVTVIAEQVADELVLHVAGAVRHPGVYLLDSTARSADLVDAAGGATADADLARINLAAPLLDGTRLYVPSLGEERPPSIVGPGPAVSAAVADRPVDINAASVAELERLSGIGPSLANEIVAHREAWGPFSSIDELLDVRGIGPAKLSGFRESVHVG